jgi:hypothetical protein
MRQILRDLIDADVDLELISRVEKELLMRERRQSVRERQVRCREAKEARLAEKQKSKSNGAK